jgi:hypothetical protein
MVFGLVVFVADRLSDCRYLSRCSSPLDSQRVRCQEGPAMKSFLIGLFGLTLLPAIGAVCWYTDRFGAFLARYVRAIPVQWGSDSNGRARRRVRPPPA